MWDFLAILIDFWFKGQMKVETPEQYCILVISKLEQMLFSEVHM